MLRSNPSAVVSAEGAGRVPYKPGLAFSDLAPLAPMR